MTLSGMLGQKLQGKGLEDFIDALLDAANKQNSTAMKIVVDLVEPAKTRDQKEETVTDAQLAELVAEFIERAAEERAQEIVRQQAARP